MERMMEGLRKATHFENAVRKLRVGLVVFALALSGTMIVLISLTSVPVVAGSWGPIVLITNDNLNNTHFSATPRVASDSFGNVHVVWKDESDLDGSGTDLDIFYKKWSSLTGSWGARVLLSADNLNESAEPRISTDSHGNVHVVWHDYNSSASYPYISTMQHRIWNSSSGNWEAFEIPVSDCIANLINPRIAVDGIGNVHFVALGSGPIYGNLWYMVWDEISHSWNAPSPVLSGPNNAKRQEIAVDNDGNVHVVYDDNTDGETGNVSDFDIYYTRLNRTSGSWEPPKHVNDDGSHESNAYFPSVASDRFGNVHVAWHDRNYTYSAHGQDSEIFYRRYEASSDTWVPMVTVTDDLINNTEASAHGQVAADSQGNAHIIWTELSDLDGTMDGYYDIFYRKWNLTSGTFEKRQPVTDPDANDYPSESPHIAIDPSDNVHVVWYDFTPLLGSGDDVDIFYRKLESDIVPVSYIGLRTEVVNTEDILLTWASSVPSRFDYYLIYGSADQREFDFTTPIYDTSSDVNPPRTTWIDVGAANSTAPKECYYIVRGVSASGGKSITSNTAGKWTRSFREGRDAFSLPLEPFVNKNVSWYSENILGTEFVRWMNATGHWVTHYPSMGEGVNDITATVGDSYEISLSSPVNFTFCGYPASMMRFHEGMGDSITFRKSLSAQVEGNDINLSWEAVTGAIGYHVFRSDKRNGLHDLSLSPIANIANTHWIDSGVVESWRSEYYYMVIPVDSSGGLGSSTYSVGVFTVEHQSGTDSFALPLKPVEPHSLDWYCDNIPSAVGMIHLMKGYWKLHAREMPEGVYDADAYQGEGYQISFDGGTTSYTFIGH